LRRNCLRKHVTEGKRRDEKTKKTWAATGCSRGKVTLLEF
jgi:hypothetical protein